MPEQIRDYKIIKNLGENGPVIAGRPCSAAAHIVKREMHND